MTDIPDDLMSSARDDVAALLAALTTAHDYLLAAKEIAVKLDVEDPHIKRLMPKILEAGKTHLAVIHGNGEGITAFTDILNAIPEQLVKPATGVPRLPSDTELGREGYDRRFGL